MKRAVGIAVLVTGIVGITAQTLLVRELLVCFSGNELTLGIALGAWLLLEAAGSWTAGRANDEVRSANVCTSDFVIAPSMNHMLFQHCPIKGEATPCQKFQVPTPNQIPIPKLQAGSRLVFGAWNLRFGWSLGFGISPLYVSLQIQAHPVILVVSEVTRDRPVGQIAERDAPVDYLVISVIIRKLPGR